MAICTGSWLPPWEGDSMHERRKQTVCFGLWVFIVILAWGIAMDQQASAHSHPGQTRVVINLPSLTLRVYQHGQVVEEYPVAVGTRATPTPVGETRVKNRVTDPVYYPINWGEKDLDPIPPGPDNPVGTVWIGLEWPGYGIHGTNNPNSIGTLASDGCIRMHNKDAEALHDIVAIGTPVEITYEVVELVSMADPWPSLKIHPDVYNEDPDYIEAAANILQPLGIWDAVDRDRLERQLESPPDDTESFTVPRNERSVTGSKDASRMAP